MKRRFPSLEYRQRWQIESAIARHKRRLGAVLRTRSEPTQQCQYSARVIRDPIDSTKKGQEHAPDPSLKRPNNTASKQCLKQAPLARSQHSDRRRICRHDVRVPGAVQITSGHSRGRPLGHAWPALPHAIAVVMKHFKCKVCWSRHFMVGTLRSQTPPWEEA